jgi:hypothetical protein
MIQDVYIKIHHSMDIKEFYSHIKKSYQDNKKVRFIFDCTGSNVSIDDMNKIKQVFDKLETETKEKLEETCIIIEGDIKRTIVNTFISTIKSKKPVRIL